jgi:hypothetical protein
MYISCHIWNMHSMFRVTLHIYSMFHLTDICMYIPIYRHMYVHIYLQTYVCTYLFTDIHTYLFHVPSYRHIYFMLHITDIHAFCTSPYYVYISRHTLRIHFMLHTTCALRKVCRRMSKKVCRRMYKGDKEKKKVCRRMSKEVEESL